jgi:uncharacterized membrane protein (UPF0127 family)
MKRSISPALIALLLFLNNACQQNKSNDRASTPSSSPSPSLSARGLDFADFEITRQQSVLVKLVVEVADTPAAQARGLMGVEKLEADRGMVFLNRAPSSGPFYMKDTLIPLDIAFWDETGTIVDVLQMEPCRSEPCKFYYSRAPYFAAVETNFNVMVGRGVARGDEARVIR